MSARLWRCKAAPWRCFCERARAADRRFELSPERVDLVVELCRQFRRLEPFAGGVTANMAQQLCCSIAGGCKQLDKWSMLDALSALSALADKSLVQRSARGAEGEQERLHLF